MSETRSASDSYAAAASPSPLGEVWSIAWPTVFTMTSYTVMQFADKLMVGRVGPLEVAAQGNGGIWSFVPIAFGLGVLTVVNTFVSQNLGAGRAARGPLYGWASCWLSVIMWVVLLLPWALMLRFVFDLVHRSQFERMQTLLHTSSGQTLLDAQIELERLGQLVPMETTYGRVLLCGAVFLLASRGIHHYFFGLHRPKVVAISAVCGNVANLFFNYALIFGSAGVRVLAEDGSVAWSLPGVPGMPALGLTGAAIGTVIGTSVELVIPLAIFLGPAMHGALGTRRLWRPRLGPIRDLLRLGWPAGVQFGNELMCWSIFMSTLVGLFGAYHQTAGWIVLGYMHLSFMPAVGFSVAVTSLVGKYIGAGEPDTATHRARLGLALAIGYMTVCGVVFLVFRRSLVAWFVAGSDVSAVDAAAIIGIGGKLMICAAFFQTVDAFGITYTGALRGAGDTVWPGVVTILYSWTLIVGGGWAMTVLWPELESVGPWIGATAYIVIFGVTMAWRFESGRWRSIKLLEPDAHGATVVAPLGPGPPAADPDASVRDFAESAGASAAEDDGVG